MVTLLVIGIAGGLQAVRDASIDELVDVAQVKLAADQSFTTFHPFVAELQEKNRLVMLLSLWMRLSFKMVTATIHTTDRQREIEFCQPFGRPGKVGDFFWRASYGEHCVNSGSPVF